MSSENEHNDQFKLVSIDGSGNSSVKPNSNKAKQAYSSYLKEDDSSSDSSSQVSVSTRNNEQDDVPQKSTSNLPEQSSNKTVTKKQSASAKGTAQLKPQPKTATKSKETKRLEEDEDDYFNEDGSINDEKESAKTNIDELKSSVASLLGNFIATLVALFSKLGALLMKPISMAMNLLIKILNIPLNILNRFISSLSTKLGNKRKALAPETIEEEAPPPPELKKSAFTDMIELNIIFMDNYKKNLYNNQKTGAMKLSKSEENLIMSMAMEAIRECAEFTVELPAPVEGIYQGIPIYQVMENITEDDVRIFLGFVKAFPGKYIGKTWKMSETYATWLINNSPTG
ncbi:MAG: hypothetical protein AABZ74_18935 [Cyanobacteriota bacterium]